MMNSLEEFKKKFDVSFWKAFKSSIYGNIPIKKIERDQIIYNVYESIKSATYFPSIPHTDIIKNKGFGVARIIPVFKIEDYCVYYFCIKELEDWLCVNRVPNTFGGWSLGGKIRQQESQEIENESTEYGRYSFNPMAWINAFKEFNSLLFSQLDNSHYNYAIQFDLANFYDSIRLDILERKIREQADSSKGWVVSLLFFFLNHWNRRNTGLHPQIVGLPQDAFADCSRILANFYLQEYDSFADKIARQYNGSYFRYSDDQFILLKKKMIFKPFYLH
jgi:hypothetical protein